MACGGNHKTIGFIGEKRNWRREGDSNPRYGFWPYTGLANQRLQPLGHLSTGRHSETSAMDSLKQNLAGQETEFMELVQNGDRLMAELQTRIQTNVVGGPFQISLTESNRSRDCCSALPSCSC